MTKNDITKIVLCSTVPGSVTSFGEIRDRMFDRLAPACTYPEISTLVTSDFLCDGRKRLRRSDGAKNRRRLCD